MLSEKLLNLAKTGAIEGCVVKVWLIDKPQDVQKSFEAIALTPNANLSIAYRYICDEFKDLPFKRTSFVTHMRGRCTCQVN